MKYKVWFLTFLITGMATQTGNAQIYKWVDENGVTHFGTTRPAYTDSRKMDLKKPHLSGFEHSKHNPTPAPQRTSISKSHTVESLASQSKGIDCKRTIHSANDHIDVKLAINKKNLSSGYITDLTYRQSASTLFKIKESLSEKACNNASGTAQSFYYCVNNNVNRLTECSRKHRYGI